MISCNINAPSSQYVCILTAAPKSALVVVQLPMYAKFSDQASNYCDAAQIISLIFLSLQSSAIVVPISEDVIIDSNGTPSLTPCTRTLML